MYLGLDLLAADVRYCEATPAALRSAAPLNVKRLELTPQSPLLVEAEQSLRVPSPPQDTNAVFKDAERPSAQRSWARRYTDALAPLRSVSPESTVGLAIAYATPPSICQGLSALLPGEGTRQRIIHACEAPIAAALELLASGRLVLPAQAAFVTPGINGSELTSLNLAADGTTLRLEVQGFLEIPAQTSLAGGALSERIAALFQAAGESAACFVAEESLAALPAELAAVGGVAFDRHTPLAEETWLLGAIRYAAIRQSAVSGLSQKALAIQRLAPRPVGIVGKNQSGEHVWRLLFPAGQTYDDLPPPLAASAATAGMLMLAEIAAPPGAPPAWLWQSDWHHWRLIVHTACRISRAAAAGQRLQFKRDKPSGRCIWKPEGDEFTAQWVADTAT